MKTKLTKLEIEELLSDERAELKSIDLFYLKKAKKIDAGFLDSCTSLTELDLSALKSIRRIEKNFLYSCCSLPSLDLSPLKNVRKIGDYFLASCHNLKKITFDDQTWEGEPYTIAQQAKDYILQHNKGI